MQKPKKTHCCIVLDRSGSMIDMAKEAVQHYNEFVEQFHAWGEDPELDIDVSLVTFNFQPYEHLWCEPSGKLKKAEDGSFKPYGGTAYYDALGYVIDKYQAQDDAHDEDVSYYVMIVSDGLNNVIRHYPKDVLAEMKKACDATGRWTFTFMGCSEGEIQDLKDLGFDPGSVRAWSKNTSANVASANLAAAAGYMGARKGGVRGMAAAYKYATVPENLDQEVYTCGAIAQPTSSGPNVTNTTLGTDDVFGSVSCVVDHTYKRPNTSSAGEAEA